jgi:hypothetical protein
MKTSEVLLWGGAAFLAYELFLKPKPPVVPYSGYIPQPANPLSSLLNLITGKGNTTQNYQQLATGVAQYSTSAANQPVYQRPASANVAPGSSTVDAYGNVYDTNTGVMTSYNTSSATYVDPQDGQIYNADGTLANTGASTYDPTAADLSTFYG